METFKSGLLADLRHELRTPVNHILGYSELLIEDAAERHLEAFIPAFQQIQSGGRRLFDSIRPLSPRRLVSFKSWTSMRSGRICVVRRQKYWKHPPLCWRSLKADTIRRSLIWPRSRRHFAV